MNNIDEKESLTALVVSVMIQTAERVGNPDSADDGHYGITMLRKKHVEIVNNRVNLSYIGKSGVLQNKYFTDAIIAAALKKAIRNSPSQFIFTTTTGFQIKADRVNRFLENNYHVSAKDLRGFLSNQYLVEKLKTLTPEKNEDDRAKQFREAVKYAAERVGHGAATLKKHYMLPELEKKFIKYGKILDLSDFYKTGGMVKMEKGGQVSYVEVDEETALPVMGYHGDAGAGIFLVSANTGRGLLVQRSENCNQGGTWAFVGGHVDSGEDAPSAAKREVEEEIGYTVTSPLHLAHLHQSDDSDFVYYNYIAIVENEFKPNLNDENTDYKWTDMDKLPEPLHFGVVDFFEEVNVLEEIQKATELYEKKAERMENGGEVEAGYKSIKGKDTIGRDIPNWDNAVVYHTTDVRSAEDIRINGYRIIGEEQSGYYGNAISFTPDLEYTKNFGGADSITTKAIVRKGARILNLNDKADSERYDEITKGGDYKNQREYIMKAGYDGLYDVGAGDLFIYNPKVVSYIGVERNDKAKKVDIREVVKKIAKNKNLTVNGGYVYLYTTASRANWNKILKSNKFKAGTIFYPDEDSARKGGEGVRGADDAILYKDKNRVLSLSGVYIPSLDYDGRFYSKEDLYYSNGVYSPKAKKMADGGSFDEYKKVYSADGSLTRPYDLRMEFPDLLYTGSPDQKKLKEFGKWLNSNKDKYVVVYHGSPHDAKESILKNGILPTSEKRRHSYQSASGYSYVSVFPTMAKQFADMGSPVFNEKQNDVWEIGIQIRWLLPDLDQLNNQRLYADRDVEDNLANSIVFGHGARVKGKIERNLIKLADMEAVSYFNLGGAVGTDTISCDDCDWTWQVSEGGDDMYICHNCGHDNTPVFEKGGDIPVSEWKMPSKEILNYAEGIKTKFQEVWALGGNEFGNTAYKMLKHVIERGHWVEDEEWFYKKWQSFIARHARDYRIAGVIANLKWLAWVSKGERYSKDVIAKAVEEKYGIKKMEDGGEVSDILLLQSKLNPKHIGFGDRMALAEKEGRGVEQTFIEDKNVNYIYRNASEDEVENIMDGGKSGDFWRSEPNEFWNYGEYILVKKVPNIREYGRQYSKGNIIGNDAFNYVGERVTKENIALIINKKDGVIVWDNNSGIRFEKGGEVDSGYAKWKRENVTYRGMREAGQPNSSAGGVLGRGLYSAPSSNKAMAREYGGVYFMVNARPKHPKVFSTMNHWEIWCQGNLYMKYSKSSFPDLREFNKNSTIEKEMLALGYDGIEITGREMVNFTPENVRYFKSEDELKNYYHTMNPDVRLEKGGEINADLREVENQIIPYIEYALKADHKLIEHYHNSHIADMFNNCLLLIHIESLMPEIYREKLKMSICNYILANNYFLHSDGLTDEIVAKAFSRVNHPDNELRNLILATPIYFRNEKIWKEEMDKFYKKPVELIRYLRKKHSKK